ncbi:MAG TPA: selenium cofactor biosynthesis protein YqeC [Aggregatilineales bacterium]|nr:selenium cofactor biosynthesis protein YqeC [Aggregatilineales bacterium]
MQLHQAFNILRGDVVAFIGAGGKTATLFRLGDELASMGWRVLATTTTTLSADKLALMPRAMSTHAGEYAISQALSETGFVFLYDAIRQGEAYGAKPSWIMRLMDAVDSDVMLIEADGANGMPLKAPYDHEPIFPPETSLVVPTVSLSAIGQPLDEDHVYNAAAITERYGFPVGGRIRAAWVAQILRDESLGLKGIPNKARVVAYLNGTTTTQYGRGRARLIAKLALKSSRLSAVVMGNARATEPVYEIQRPLGAIVLAAGLSSRMGQSKVLLPWSENKTIIAHITEQLIRARIEHINVITGHLANDVKAALELYDIGITYNRAYKSGEMLSSLKAGLRAMPSEVSACFIVLGDQPSINARVLNDLQMRYAEHGGDLLIPSYHTRRGHPILIGRRYWHEILMLSDKSTLRDFIGKHEADIHYVPVESDSILRDVDTPQDYDEERWRAGLK